MKHKKITQVWQLFFWVLHPIVWYIECGKKDRVPVQRGARVVMGCKKANAMLGEIDARVENLILYLCQESVDDATFGLTKLNKLMFYVDFTAYKWLSDSISGLTYQRIQNGPALKAMKPLLDQMEDRGDISIQSTRYWAYVQKTPVANQKPDTGVFSPKEIELIDSVIRKFREFNAKQISQQAYADFKLNNLRDKETIPYGFATIDHTAEITQDDIQWAIDRGLGEMAETWHNSRRAKPTP